MGVRKKKRGEEENGEEGEEEKEEETVGAREYRGQSGERLNVFLGGKR